MGHLVSPPALSGLQALSLSSKRRPEDATRSLSCYFHQATGQHGIGSPGRSLGMSWRIGRGAGKESDRDSGGAGDGSDRRGRSRGGFGEGIGWRQRRGDHSSCLRRMTCTGKRLNRVLSVAVQALRAWLGPSLQRPLPKCRARGDGEAFSSADPSIPHKESSDTQPILPNTLTTHLGDFVEWGPRRASRDAEAPWRGEVFVCLSGRGTQNRLEPLNTPHAFKSLQISLRAI